MRRKLIAMVLVAASSVAGIHSLARPLPADEVRVTTVLDGDTVILAGSEQRVRLASIDAPEMSHGPSKPGQPFSVQSAKWLERELQGKIVKVKCVDQDRYGRKVCNFYRDGHHVNKELVRAGLAWANTAQARYLRDRSVLDAQQEARATRRGLWAESKPIEPWNWRRECWERRTCAAH